MYKHRVNEVTDSYQGASGVAEIFSQLKYYYMYKNKTSVKLIF